MLISSKILFSYLSRVLVRFYSSESSIVPYFPRVIIFAAEIVLTDFQSVVETKIADHVITFTF